MQWVINQGRVQDGHVHFCVFQDRDEVEVNKIVFLYLKLLSMKSLKKACKTPNLDIFLSRLYLWNEQFACGETWELWLLWNAFKSVGSGDDCKFFFVEWSYISFERLLLVGVNLLILLFLFRRRHHRIKRFRLVGPLWAR